MRVSVRNGRTPTRTRPGRGPAAAVLGCVLAASLLVGSLLAGCAAVRSNLGTTDSACYVALPTASRAVGSHGRLIGVHLSTLDRLRRQSPQLYGTVNARRGADQRICVTAFVGHFDAGSVSRPLGLPSGPVAVVVSEIPSNQILGTIILARTPLSFGHTHIG